MNLSSVLPEAAAAEDRQLDLNFVLSTRADRSVSWLSLRSKSCDTSTLMDAALEVVLEVVNTAMLVSVMSVDVVEKVGVLVVSMAVVVNVVALNVVAVVVVGNSELLGKKDKLDVDDVVLCINVDVVVELCVEVEVEVVIAVVELELWAEVDEVLVVVVTVAVVVVVLVVVVVRGMVVTSNVVVTEVVKVSDDVRESMYSKLSWGSYIKSPPSGTKKREVVPLTVRRKDT